MSRESEPVPERNEWKAPVLKYADTCYLAIHQRVRSRRHPDLTGTIKCYEWNEPGVLSAIPYNVAWDDSARAFDVLGMFALYQTDTTIEAIPDA